MLASRKAAFAAGAVVALVLTTGTAYAATGGNFILGKSNKADAVTKVENTKGTALSLIAKSGSPALKVSNSKKVAKLNADELDGKSSSDFALSKGKTGYIEASGQGFDDDQNGFPDFIIAVASCPSGTQMTGGGSQDLTATGFVVIDAPSSKNAWGVATITSNSTNDDPADLVASVVCYNPKGTVPGASAVSVQRTPLSTIPKGFVSKLQAKAAASR